MLLIIVIRFPGKTFRLFDEADTGLTGCHIRCCEGAGYQIRGAEQKDETDPKKEKAVNSIQIGYPFCVFAMGKTDM